MSSYGAMLLSDILRNVMGIPVDFLLASKQNYIILKIFTARQHS